MVLAVIALASPAGWAQDAGTGAEASAQPAPPADEIKRVLDYQENGKDRGPVLLDLIPCLKVDQTKGSPTQFTCIEPVTGPVKKGALVNAWTQWFCPRGGKYEDISIQSMLDGQPRNTVDITIGCNLARTRTWRAFTLSKPGKWQIRVVQAAKGSALRR